MNRVAVRLAAFAVVLAASFGAAYAIGTATDSEAPVPVHQDHEGMQP